ncbi:hypothetical protein [Aeromonas sp. FDAARGOS 1417]|uniref:hypothetical protein n=1 Tax=Aeromonas TaxID=642 RepID=UPI001C223453|nr:hypothetical protein [Aeromonas sp. FDAARGOS 1417]QWZ62714.1 hypothetical protein I6L47_13310 [Aeromonas sp. FDAARGOS 1417]
MKKNILALSVVTALSSLALAGCGGGGDGASTNNGNNSGNGGNATKPALTATFIDSAVAGLNYTCGNYSDVTNSQGQFLFNDGDTCTFKLGSIPLGETQVKKGQTLVTPYTIAEKGDKDRAIRIAALLQTMDGNNNPDDGIQLVKEEVAKLGNTLRFDSDDAFNTSLNEALKAVQPGKTVVDTATAAAHMNASLAVINGQSVAVDKVLRNLLEESQDWQKTNVENKLREYKDILNAETGDQGKADREVVKSVITLMEITNDPIVSNRFDIQPHSAPGQGYQTSLAKILDIIVNPSDMITFAIKEQPTQTEDISRLMGKYALELESINNTLANIVKPDYLAKYGDNDKLTLTFAQVQELRATALAMSSAMNVISAYQYGSASQFKVTQENVTFDKFSTTFSSATGNTRKITLGTETVDAEYLNANIRPAELLKDNNFFKFNQNYGALLAKAKKQLQQAIQLTLATSLPESDSDLNREMLKDLQKHLAGEKSTVELSDYVLIDDEGEWLGQHVETKYTVDLNSYFSYGIDRDAVDIGVTEYCKYRGETIGEYDVNLSKALDTAMCHLSESEVKSIYQQIDAYHSNYPFYSLGTPDTGENYWTQNYAQGIPMRWFADIRAKQGGNFGKVFVSCKARLPAAGQEWQEKPCDWLLSNSLSEE